MKKKRHLNSYAIMRLGSLVSTIVNCSFEVEQSHDVFLDHRPQGLGYKTNSLSSVCFLVFPFSQTEKF